MGRTPPIRLTKNDRKTYARLVKNAKAKARNVLKNYGIDLNEVVKVPKIEDIKSRKEFNEIAQKLSSFTNRANTRYQFVKNDYGKAFSKHDVYLAKKYNKSAINQAQSLRDKLSKAEFKVAGKPVMTVGQRLGLFGRSESMGISVPAKFNLNNFTTRGDLNDFIYSMKTRSDKDYFDRRMEQFLENWVTRFSLSFNDNDLVDKIVFKIAQMPASDFYEMYFQFKEFDFKLWDSDGNPRGTDGDIRMIEKYLDDYEKGEIDFDYKSFGNRV